MLLCLSPLALVGLKVKANIFHTVTLTNFAPPPLLLLDCFTVFIKVKIVILIFKSHINTALTFILALFAPTHHPVLSLLLRLSGPIPIAPSYVLFVCYIVYGCYLKSLAAKCLEPQLLLVIS